MVKIQRNEILDYITYQEQRKDIRPKIIAIKRKRRVHLGEYFTFLFENRDTIRYQIHEMILAEKIVKEADIQHEIDTYNELFGEEGSFPCVLLIEIDDKEERNTKLAQWVDLPKTIYLKLNSGEKIYAVYDERQMDEHKVSSVQYLYFNTKGDLPVAVGVELEALKNEVDFTPDQLDSLREDLKEFIQ